MKTTKEPSVHPTSTPTSNIQVIPPKLVAPTPVPTPDPIYNNVTDNREKGVQSLPNARYNLRYRTPTFKQQATQSILAQHIFQQPKVYHIYDEHEQKQYMGDLIKGSKGKMWYQALSNEWGRLAQGNESRALPTKAIEFIDPSRAPTGK